ncbi:RibD family protein [Pediococcus acidilactici]|uniref:RibD family protein n=1 Tax=Pediococcus acidilactici TaxID=1254 RepID=UPI000A652D1E|nr:dihydrofolate reductase family protein [Pediococcus acidilactici]
MYFPGQLQRRDGLKELTSLSILNGILKKIAEYLAKIGVQSLLIEGGSHLHAEFIASNLVDEIIVYVAPKIFGGQGLSAVQGKAAQSSNFQLVSREFIGLDTKFKLRRM